jgi:hypothetical protein
MAFRWLDEIRTMVGVMGRAMALDATLAYLPHRGPKPTAAERDEIITRAL